MSLNSVNHDQLVNKNSIFIAKFLLAGLLFSWNWVHFVVLFVDHDKLISVDENDQIKVTLLWGNILTWSAFGSFGLTFVNCLVQNFRLKYKSNLLYIALVQLILLACGTFLYADQMSRLRKQSVDLDEDKNTLQNKALYASLFVTMVPNVSFIIYLFALKYVNDATLDERLKKYLYTT